MNLFDKLNKNVIFFDGGLGSLLIAKGITAEESPETLNITAAEALTDIHLSYLNAGSDIVTTNTFGANSIKFNSDKYTLEEVIISGINNAKTAVKMNGKNALVAFGMGPTGKLLEPMGELKFEDAVASYTEAASIAEKAGADLIIIETMTDTYEMKAAVLGAKEGASLPVTATFSFDKDGRLLTGGDIKAGIALLEGLKVDALGINCGFGPDVVKNLLPEFVNFSTTPIIIQPNAGMPVTEGGRLKYTISPEEFAKYQAEFFKEGVRILGGCCGTTPDYIAALVKACEGIKPKEIKNRYRTVVSSFAIAREINDTHLIIGERINPTGKKLLKQALKDKNLDYIVSEGITQKENGAHILDVNVGMPGIDEEEMMLLAIKALQASNPLPLQIDTSNPSVMEKAMRYYNGKPLVNSVNGSEESMHGIFPLVSKYGGVVIALTLDDNGIPETAEGRLEIAKRIAKCAESYGIPLSDIIFDPLAMAVSSDSNAAITTLQAIKLIKKELNAKVSLGVSNISFGLPNREVITSTFFASALSAGLDLAIVNPSSTIMMDTYYSYLALAGLDEHCEGYIERLSDRKIEYGNSAKADTVLTDTDSQTVSDPLFKAIVNGAADSAYNLTKEMLVTHKSEHIVDNILVKALDYVGKSFEAKKIFLPQLMKSAEAAKSAFKAIKESLQSGTGDSGKGPVLIATVKGDIHDIGKNILKLMLENYGFNVIDLGKDVSPERIIDEVISKEIKLVGLSALMTTTVESMADTIKLLREKAPDCKIMVGGAVLTYEYAKEIGADFYGKDAMSGVIYAQSVFNVPKS